MIAVTGSTGHLGRLAIDALLRRGVDAGEVIALARSPQKAADLAERGVQVRRAEYNEPESLGPALEGVERVLFISGSEVGRRVEQHRNVVNAARDADVRLLAYTSILRADSSEMLLAAEHRETERMIRESGVPFVFLRNSWYTENYTGMLGQTLEHGAVLGCAGDGRVSAATRADYAEAAAAVVAHEGHANAIYELGGDDAFTMNELAGEISRQSGQEVVYRDLPFEEYVQVLEGAGLPEEAAKVYADGDLGIARGELYTESDDLRRLAGRPTTPLSDAVAEALEARS